MNPYTRSVLVGLKTHYVFINFDAIRDYAAKIWDEDFKLPNWRVPVLPEDDKLFVEFIGVANSINFCFSDPYTGRKFDTEYKGEIYRGAFAMQACLMRALDNGIPILDPKFLSDLRITTAQKIFEYANNPIPMMNERVDNLQNVGKVLLEHNSSFLQLIEESGWQAFNHGYGFVEQLVQHFDSYRDAVLYKGHYLNFAKRAQLMAMVYHGRAVDSDVLMPLGNPWAIGPIVDYVVPASLRSVGILVYEKSLQDDIDNGKIIPKGSDQEIEIRIATVGAVSNLLKRIRKIRKIRGKDTNRGIHMGHMDYRLWHEGRKKRLKHHLTPTTGY